jgi:ligand-binding sensor domain-containing protein/signal transduction histidine kinase
MYLTLVVPAFSQGSAKAFVRMGLEDGLPQTTVYTLAKTKDGFLWSGTQNGLAKYDGYSFTSYFKEKDADKGLSSNFIWALHAADNGQLWIGTQAGGLHCYTPHKDQFDRFSIPPSDARQDGRHTVRSIMTLGDHSLLAGTEAGLYLLDIPKKKFTALRPEQDTSFLHQTIYCLERIDSNHVLIGAKEKLYLYNIPLQRTTVVALPHPLAAGIHDFERSEDGTIWAGTGKGLFHLEVEPESSSMKLLQHYRSTDNLQNALASDYISALLITSNRLLWIATNNGIQLLDTHHTEKGFTSYQHTPGVASSLSDQIVFDIEEVEPGILWAATQRGISQFDEKNSAFNSLKFEGLDAVFCGNAAHGLTQSDNGDWLVCTDNGLLRLSTEGNELVAVQCMSSSTEPELDNDFLISISDGKEGKKWIALRRGGFASLSYNNDSYQWKGYQLPSEQYPNIGCNDLLEDEEGQLWIGSSGLGLWKRDLATGQYTNYNKAQLSGNYIFYLFKDRKDRLWIATADGGLCMKPPHEERFICYTHDAEDEHTISNNMVLFVFEDQRGNIWSGTVDGLNLLTEEGKFIRFYQKDGLPDNVIYGMLEDEQGKLWISTGKGLASISYDQQEMDIRSYSKSDGLVSNEFNQHSFYKMPDGNLIFGTHNGLTFFDPDQLSAYSTPPRLHFTNFQVFNQPYPLDHPIDYTSGITLPYHQNFLSFEFVGINFEQAEANQYAYRMEGLYDEWIPIGNRRFVSFPGLKPGSYQLMIKAANHDGVWSSSARSIQIRIQPPPWKTWWAYLGYALALMLLIYSLFRYRLHTIRQLERTKQEERTLFRKRSARDFHDEAGNTITKISLLTGIAKREARPGSTTDKMLEQIEENVQQLRSSMRDFIWVIDPGNDDLYNTLSRLNEFAIDLFEYAPTQFAIRGLDDHLKSIQLAGHQRRHLLLIFKEAFNNTIKHARAENAMLEIRKLNNTEILIQYKDDGEGFDIKNDFVGNGLKNMQARAHKIGADLKIDSQNNSGTTFSLTLNITQMGH